MKAWIFFFATAVMSVGCFAQATPSEVLHFDASATRQMVQEHGLPYTLSDAFGWYQLALEKRYEAAQLADLKMHDDEDVKAIGMGTVEAERMRELDAIKGPPVPPDNGELAAASDKAYSEAKTAYVAWIAGKAPAQREAAKTLYVAWRTYMDALNSVTGDPLEVDSENPVAANAYHQAVNEFKVNEIQ